MYEWSICWICWSSISFLSDSSPDGSVHGAEISQQQLLSTDWSLLFELCCSTEVPVILTVGNTIRQRYGILEQRSRYEKHDGSPWGLLPAMVEWNVLMTCSCISQCYMKKESAFSIMALWFFYQRSFSRQFFTQPSHRDIMLPVNTSANHRLKVDLCTKCGMKMLALYVWQPPFILGGGGHGCDVITSQQSCQTADHSSIHTPGYFWGQLCRAA